MPKVVELVYLGLLVVLTQFKSSLAQTNDSLQYHYVCPKGFENIGRRCYHFSNNTGTWFQAYFNCKDFSQSNFTVFTDRYDQRQLEHFLFRKRNKIRGDSYWVGGFKDWKKKKWVYTDGSPMQFPMFKEIHSNEAEDNWTCLLVDGNRKRWRAENCMEKRRFICETKAVGSVVLKVLDKKVKRKITIDECVSNTEHLTKKQKKKCMKMLNGSSRHGDRSGDVIEEPAAVIQQAKPAYVTQPSVIRAISHICPQNWMSLGNKCYLFSKDKVTWSDAHFNCGQINSKLAMIKSKSQDQKLRIFLNGFTENNERWIGGRYNGKTREWIWALNGKPLRYKGFFDEPASNSSGTLNWEAIILDPLHGYQWSHRNELEKHFYICQIKGRAVKRLNYPRRPSATIQILPDRRYLRRNQQLENRFRNRGNRTSRRTNRNIYNY